MPLAEVIHATPSRLKLSGLTAADMVEATCLHCYATRIHTPLQLHLQHPSELRMDDLLRDLRCPKCNQLGARDWRVMRAHYGP